MHALLVTLGSWGDIHPFLGIGLRLRQRGHDVTLVTNAPFHAAAEAHGLEFVGLGTIEEYEAFSRDPAIWHPHKGPLRVLSVVAETIRLAYDAIAEHRRPDTVIAASTLALAARVAQERLGVPMASVHLAPMVFRSLSDPPCLPGVPLHRLPRFAQRGFWWMADRMMLDPVLAPPLNALRAELGLGGRLRSVMDQWWHSPQRVLGLWPDWFGPAAPDWPEQTALCGFPLYDERATAEMPPELERFLEAGEAPVAFTPGSAMLFGERFFAAAVGACRRLGLRCLLLSRSGHHVPMGLPREAIHVPFAPFSRLLPRCRALVHHGGIGTLSQGLAAGLPQVIMPMAHDQHDNAQRLERLGVGRSLAPRRFTAKRLSAVLEDLLVLRANDVSGRCAQLRGRISLDAGIDAACEELELLSPDRGAVSSKGHAQRSRGQALRASTVCENRDAAASTAPSP